MNINQTLACLAKFIKELHGIDYSALEPVYIRTEMGPLLKNFNERFGQISFDLTKFKDRIDDICGKAQLYVPKRDNLSLLHNDLYYCHLLFSEHNRLTGVIDWGDCAIGTPVADLGIVFQFLPKSAHDSFFEIFGEIEKHAIDFACFLGLYYAIALLWFGHHRQDPDLIRTSLWTLNEL